MLFLIVAVLMVPQNTEKAVSFVYFCVMTKAAAAAS